MIAVIDIVNLIATVVLSVAAIIISIYEITSAKKNNLLVLEKENKTKEAFQKLIEFQTENSEFKKLVYECSILFDACKNEMSSNILDCLSNQNLQTLVKKLFDLQDPINKFLNKSNDVIFYTLNNSEFLPQGSIGFISQLESKRISLDDSFAEMITHTNFFVEYLNNIIESLNKNIRPDESILDYVVEEYNIILNYCKNIEKYVSEIKRISELLHELVVY